MFVIIYSLSFIITIVCIVIRLIVITSLIFNQVKFHESGPDFPDQTSKTVFVTFNVASHHTVSIRGDLVSRKENFAFKNWTTVGCIRQRQAFPFSNPLFSNRGDLKVA